MRAPILVVVALTMIVIPAIARQEGVLSAQAPRRSIRVPVKTSDLLTHSPFATCAAGQARRAARPARSRVATWNIRAARSASLDAIARELQAMHADVIALQEVDVGTRRSGFVDEPAVLATALGFHYAFAASIRWDVGDYGLAVLSRWPLTSIRRHRLDSATAAEPRIVLEATVCASGRPLILFNHHADGRASSREAGFAALRRIVDTYLGRRILVLGDFNARPDAAGVRGLIDAGLVDLGAARNVNSAKNGRIDYLLADRQLAGVTLPARVWPTDKSDHNAVLADFEW